MQATRDTESRLLADSPVEVVAVCTSMCIAGSWSTISSVRNIGTEVAPAPTGIIVFQGWSVGAMSLHRGGSQGLSSKRNRGELEIHGQSWRCFVRTTSATLPFLSPEGRQESFESRPRGCPSPSFLQAADRA